MKNDEVSIVILTYNRVDLLDDLLKSLIKICGHMLEIIVVDNHSEDKTEKMMKEKYSNCKYIQTESNIGVSARNLGIKEAQGNIIICLDDDVFGIDDKAIEQIQKSFEGNKLIAAINFMITDYYTGEICNWVHHCKVEDYCDKIFQTYEITEGAVAFRKSALELTELYPEYFFISHEGPDLAFKLIDKGNIIIYTNEIKVQHRHSDLGRKSWTTYYYDTRNQFWLAARNFPFTYAIPYLIRGILSTLVYSIRDGYFIYWLRAMKDGISYLPKVWKDRKIVSERTINVLKIIDNMRPPLFYLIRKRFFKRDMRL